MGRTDQLGVEVLGPLRLLDGFAGERPEPGLVREGCVAELGQVAGVRCPRSLVALEDQRRRFRLAGRDRLHSHHPAREP